MEDAECAAKPASFERTRRALQLQGALPMALEGPPALHPDGPLQQRHRFHAEDLEDERRLLLRLWLRLRRGDLKRGMELCEQAGQPWRTALLQGMMPFALGHDEPVEVYAMEDDDMVQLKEQHKDWTDCGVLEPGMTNYGNPWRRLWKEQCWDSADRNLQHGGAMDVHELAMYGFCAGHHEAMKSACGSSWGDCCFGELHCLKEWLVERLLSEGSQELCEDSAAIMGEGDGEWEPDPTETPACRAQREAKLYGRLRDVPAAMLEDTVAEEVRQLLRRLRSECAPPHVRDEADSSLLRLQAQLLEAAWQSTGTCADALETLRSWLSDGFDSAPCPFFVMQFACHFAIWQKDVAAAAGERPLDVDDIVSRFVREMSSHVAEAGLQRCLQGSQVELIVEYVSKLSLEQRLDSFVGFLLGSCSCPGAPGDGSAGAELPALRAAFLGRSLQAFWARFPTEPFSLLAVLARRALHPPAREEQVRPWEVSAALQGIVEFWLVLRDKAASESSLCEALSGLRVVCGLGPASQDEAQTAEDFARLALERAVLPLLVDCLLVLSAREPSGASEALELLPALQGSVLWRDAFHSGARSGESLAELEWHLMLCQRQQEWSVAHAAVVAARAAAGPRLEGYGLDLRLAGGLARGALAEAELQCAAARAAVLEHALPRLARDRPLLRQLPDTHTLLPEEHWERLRRSVATQVLFLLLSIFEGEGDFDGAMNDLAVAVAQSPWMLKLLPPQPLRAFLRRFAFVPAGATPPESAL